MAMWKRVQTLDQTALTAVGKYYEQHFPIDVRNLFSTFIEAEVLGKRLEAENVNHHSAIRNFIESLMEQIEARIKVVDGDNPFYIRQKLAAAVEQFKLKYENNQLGLFQVIKACLDMENTLIAQDTFASQEHDEILEASKDLKERISNEEIILRDLDQKQNEFESDLNQLKNFDMMLTHMRDSGTAATVHQEQYQQLDARKTALNKKLHGNVNNIVVLMQQIEKTFDDGIKLITQLQNQILQELSRWKYEQQQAANGDRTVSNLTLDKLQLWCEESADIIWNTYLHIKKAEFVKTANKVFESNVDKLPPCTFPDLKKMIVDLLTMLFKASFVVEEQPPQVMKQTSKFPNPIIIRHLCGHQLNAHMNPPQVSVRLIEEAMAKRLMSVENCTIQDRGGISSGPRVLEFNKDTKSFSTTFKNCQLKNFKRLEKKGVGLERVMEDKFCLYFEACLSVGEMKLKLWTISLPTVVISHGSQEAQAVATITWDNGFGEIGRDPFVIPNRVPWEQLAKILRQKFYSMTGRELDDNINLPTLEGKLSRVCQSPDYVTWSEFCKDELPGTKFSFWSWCYEIIKLIEKFLKAPWCDGYIMGIIEREIAESMLAKCRPGTFLARFSDSRLGAISLSWIHTDGKVYSVNPLTKNDLTSKAFADTVMDLENLVYLYPDIPKADAFQKYCKPPPTAVTPGATKVPYVPIVPHINVPSSDNGNITPAPSEANGGWRIQASPARIGQSIDWTIDDVDFAMETPETEMPESCIWNSNGINSTLNPQSPRSGGISLGTDDAMNGDLSIDDEFIRSIDLAVTNGNQHPDLINFRSSQFNGDLTQL